MCTVHNAGEYKINARESYTVAPKFVFCGIGMRMGEPLADLLFGLGFTVRDRCVCVPYVFPKSNILFGGVFFIKGITPKVGEALKSCTFDGCKSADGVSRVNNSVVVAGAASVDESITAVFKTVLTDISCS